MVEKGARVLPTFSLHTGSHQTFPGYARNVCFVNTTNHADKISPGLFSLSSMDSPGKGAGEEGLHF